jgi:mannose/cellobiose epimerase-like protein (N-acyl-D-glucosamine 2-epimerase family)
MTRRTSRIATVVAIAAAAMVVQPPLGNATTSQTMADPLEPAAVVVPEVLKGDTWLRHHREDLMPYWDMPAALGVPVGNFPSFRDRAGQLDPANTNRGLSTLARQVYGYSLAFMLTGEERYLTYAKAGLDWINTKAKDPVHGGYFGELKVDGTPANREANKDVFDLASLGLAYGMYFNVTRDPAAEADLLAVRDLLFDKYYDATTNRVKDTLRYDLATEVDTGGNGGDITNYLVPVTAMYLFNTPLLTDPARRAQFRNDIRLLTQALINRHKGGKNPAGIEQPPWWFWGRTARVGNFNALQTDFGHNIKSYEMIYNANQMFADHPWEGLSTDRTTLLGHAWDAAASRWNQRLRSFQPGDVELDSAWWMHNEADQTLAALDLNEGFTHIDQLARSAQTWLDVYVDHDPAYPGEVFARIERTGTMTSLAKATFGKNMLHAHEHALIMYLHGRELEGKPAKLYYAFPSDQALTAVTKPYWFDASGEFREVTGNLSSLPGRQVVEVSFTGIGDVPNEPFPPPSDTTAPVTVATVSPSPNAAGWNRDEVSVSFQAADNVVGVKEIHVRVEDNTAAAARVAYIDPGDTFTLPALTADGEYDITYSAVDELGNTEEPQTLQVRLDRTAPSLSGLPTAPCVIWPPNERMVHVADVEGNDTLSGVDQVLVTGTSNEPGDDDIRIVGGSVDLRAQRDDEGTGRIYTLDAAVTDLAGNATAERATCTVPHDRRP